MPVVSTRGRAAAQFDDSLFDLSLGHQRLPPQEHRLSRPQKKPALAGERGQRFGRLPRFRFVAKVAMDLGGQVQREGYRMRSQLAGSGKRLAASGQRLGRIAEDEEIARRVRQKHRPGLSDFHKRKSLRNIVESESLRAKIMRRAELAQVRQDFSHRGVGRHAHRWILGALRKLDLPLAKLARFAQFQSQQVKELECVRHPEELHLLC